ncbi:epimerase [Serinibacter arcticus]|uniref:Epimerase n=1 Tax=Serinibacter arcticus TaxID=1655435 RepID=A0A2U1ZWS3_9MICO|nr:epimerase [Serinibacter arcticus]
MTGATGYVGSRLVPALLEAGHAVRASASSAGKLDSLWWGDRAEHVAMDVDDDDQVREAVAGVETVVYLIHGLDAEDFVRKDREAAERMARHARAAGVARIVYLSGIVPDVPREDLSDHIRSRLEVEEALGDSGIPTVSLRAAVLLGSGSTSFEIIRQISERLPLQTIPTWMHSEIQPIAVVDAVAALVGAVGWDGSRVFDVGGPDRLPYPDLLATYARITELPRPQIPLPLLPEGAVGAIAARLTDVPTATVEALVDSLSHDMVAADDDFVRELLPAGHRLVGLEESIRRALADKDPDADPATADPMGPLPQDPDWAEGGSGIVSRITGAIDAFQKRLG